MPKQVQNERRMFNREPADKTLNSRRRAWVELYKEQTGFDALMDDYYAGNESFKAAAAHSVQWYRDYFEETERAITRKVPV